MAKKQPLLTHCDAKRTLRRIAILNRQSIGPKNQKRLSQLIISKLFSTPEFLKAKNIATFIGFASEVLTDGIIEYAWSHNTNVVVPMTQRGLDDPFFVLFKKGDILKRTARGPMELSTSKRAFNFKAIDLVLVPGLAFDRRGHRLGYGGGVYDRILQKTKHAMHIGLFFSQQEFVCLPTEKHDRPMEMIITNEAVHRFATYKSKKRTRI